MKTDKRGELYANNRGLAVKLARHFYVKFPLIRQRDIAEEALSLLGLLCARWYEPGAYGNNDYRGPVRQPGPWLYLKIYWGLMTFCQQKQPQESACDLSRNEAKVGWWDNLLRQLGGDARLLAETIVSLPADLYEDLTGTKVGRLGIKRQVWFELFRAEGWEPARLDKAWKEVEAAL